MGESIINEKKDASVTDSQIEGVKLAYDYLKHLTTLGTGAIVILATFASKLDGIEEASSAKHALVALVLSVICTSLAASFYAVREPSHNLKPPKGGWLTVATICWVIGNTAFIYALINLVLFANANLGR